MTKNYIKKVKEVPIGGTTCSTKANSSFSRNRNTTFDDKEKTTQDFFKCTKCNREKELTSFHKNKSKANGRESWCIDCVKKKKKKNYQNKKRQKSGKVLNTFTVWEFLAFPEVANFVQVLKPIIEEILE